MLDYQALLDKLTPKPDGESVAKMRVGVVTALNSNGTADLLISGVAVPGVPRLNGAIVLVGEAVQIITYLGSMLILGRAATNAKTAPLGLWTRAQNDASSGTLPNTLASAMTTPTVTFVKNRVYEVKMHGGIVSTLADAYVQFAIYRAGPATQIGEFYRFGCPTTGANYNASASGFYFTTANDVSGAIALYVQASTASVVSLVASTSTPRNLEVWDVGDTSQFPGINTW